MSADKARNSDYSDHELITAFAELLDKLKGCHADKYVHFHKHMGSSCPYTLKSKKAFVQRHKEELIQLVSELNSNIFKE